MSEDFPTCVSEISTQQSPLPSRMLVLNLMLINVFIIFFLLIVIYSVWQNNKIKIIKIKLGNSPGAGKCPVPGQRNICKCPTPGTDKAGKCPEVARGAWAQLELTDALQKNWYQVDQCHFAYTAESLVPYLKLMLSFNSNKNIVNQLQIV